jgi:hypothetical protein
MNYLPCDFYQENTHGDHIINGQKSYTTPESRAKRRAVGFSLRDFLPPPPTCQEKLRACCIDKRGGLKQALVDEALTVVELISQRRKKER